MKKKKAFFIGIVILSVIFSISVIAQDMNVDDTVSKMTLEEKACLVVGTGMYIAGMEGADNEALAGQFRITQHALVPATVEDDVLVDLVAENIEVRPGGDCLQGGDVLGIQRRTRGVVG